MSSLYKDNTRNVINKITQNSSIFLRTFADEVVKLSTPNTPKREGFLRRDVLRQVLGLNGKVEWRKDYAAKMETQQFRNYTTPGTGPHYAEDAIAQAVKKTSSIAKRSGLT